MTRLKERWERWIRCCCSCLAFSFATGALPAQTNEHLLADVDGFDSETIYPIGPLQAVADGLASWTPSAQPAQIVSLGGSRGKVLRRSQTGTDNVDYLRFPQVTEGTLTIKFDARASSLDRTLDIVLMPTSGGSMASMLGWGTVAGKISYYDGTAWVPVFNLDTNWHSVEIVNYIGGASNYFDLKIDGTNYGQNLPWRNVFTPGTGFGRLRIGGIRGPVGQFGDIDNLVVNGTASLPVPELPFVLTNAHLDDGEFHLSFEADLHRNYILEKSESLNRFSWESVDLITGEGTLYSFHKPVTNQAPTYYRVARMAAMQTNRNDGFRGIWFTLGQFSEHGDKYSGGLGTYTANHVPIAIYSSEVNKTFFVYGGTVKDQRHLLIMASFYDHATHQVMRPTIVHDKEGVNDPHDNASITLDADGHIWIFVSGRARSRPGFKYRSKAPYNVNGFDLMMQDEITYPQPWHLEGKGFFHLFTKYTAGRELYWETSSDGTNWSGHQKLAGIGGHYQVSNTRDGKVGTFFNRHPGGSVDKRTDLYYVQTTDFGTNWTTVDGAPLTLPLATTNNPALIIDYAGQNKLVYGLDLNFDTNGHPVMLYITSAGYQPGPQNDPRTWTITRWNGSQWITSTVCQSDHNYDMGSLYIDGANWFIIGPTQTGPQPYGTGGEMALWSSQDEGLTWTMVRQITHASAYNHTYARRPKNAADPFFAFWADGDPGALSPSRLYFSNSDGTQVWRLPYDSSAPFSTPEQ